METIKEAVKTLQEAAETLQDLPVVKSLQNLPAIETPIEATESQ